MRDGELTAWRALCVRALCGWLRCEARERLARLRRRARAAEEQRLLAALREQRAAAAKQQARVALQRKLWVSAFGFLYPLPNASQPPFAAAVTAAAAAAPAPLDGGQLGSKDTFGADCDAERQALSRLRVWVSTPTAVLTLLRQYRLLFAALVRQSLTFLRVCYSGEVTCLFQRQRRIILTLRIA